MIDEGEREEFRAVASAAGQSLSEWMRDAGRERLSASRPPRLVTESDMVDFFATVDADRAAAGVDAPEEDWDVIKARMQTVRYDELDPLGVDS